MAKLASVKEVISQTSMELGIAQKPVSNVTATQDQDIIQMLSLLQAVAAEVLKDEPYKRSLGDGVWLSSSAGVKKLAVTADTDLILFDGRLAINGLKFRFLKAKGLEFGEELRDFATRMNKLASAINGRVLDLNEDVDRVT